MDLIGKSLHFLVQRLSEPSTWAGIGIAAAATASALESHVGLGAALLSGIVAFLVPEKKG